MMRRSETGGDCGEKNRFKTEIVRPTEATNEWLRALNSAELSDGLSLAALIKRPELSYASIAEAFPPPERLREEEANRVETELKFAGYLKRQEEEIARVSRMEHAEIPADFDFLGLPNLSVEVRERLCQVRPRSLGQARRIPGVTPAAVSLIAIYLKRRLAKCEAA